MVEVRLHGALGKQFGTIWNLDIATPGEAVAAIDSNFPGFRKAITDLSRTGHCFRVRTKTHDYNDSDIGVSLGASSRLDIIPIVTGASAGVRFVSAFVLAAIAIFLPGPWSPALVASTRTPAGRGPDGRSGSGRRAAPTCSSCR